MTRKKFKKIGPKIKKDQEANLIFLEGHLTPGRNKETNNVSPLYVLYNFSARVSVFFSNTNNRSWLGTRKININKISMNFLTFSEK